MQGDFNCKILKCMKEKKGIKTEEKNCLKPFENWTIILTFALKNPFAFKAQ